ncbi:MAG: hypothetical protein IK093_07565 [Ruminiclostridium sp.]|nr:hypothetical protein [Ruminiclostridium sp.]
MLNIDGFRSHGLTAPAGQGTRAYGRKDSKEKSDRAEKNTDKADFSSFMSKDKDVDGIGGGFKVGAASQKSGGLSQKAQDYLEKLKKKYGNMDFIIQDYSSDEEADKLLAKGKGEYNVLITPDLLEKMAEDEETAAKYEGMIDESVEAIDGVRTGLGEDADMVDKYGVTFDSEGNMSIRALLAGGLTGKDGSSTVKASTVEDMLAQLNEAKEAQAEKLAKMREEKAKEAEEDEEELTVDTDEVDGEIKRIKDDRKDAAMRMNTVLSKEKQAELEELLKGLDTELAEKDNEAYRRQHAHFSAKA